LIPGGLSTGAAETQASTVQGLYTNRIHSLGAYNRELLVKGLLCLLYYAPKLDLHLIPGGWGEEGVMWSCSREHDMIRRPVRVEAVGQTTQQA
jgi:hypothetical protein